MLQVFPATDTAHYQQARSLILEYANARRFDAALAGLAHELKELPTYYDFILLATYEGQAAGCVALQALSSDIGEMKRLYVREAYRRYGIGRTLVAAFLAEARKRAYTRVRLDSHPGMIAAQQLYRSFGFVEIDRYNNNPIEGIRFFELYL